MIGQKLEASIIELQRLYIPQGFLEQYAQLEKLSVELGESSTKELSGGLLLVNQPLLIDGVESDGVYTMTVSNLDPRPGVVSVKFWGSHPIGRENGAFIVDLEAVSKYDGQFVCNDTWSKIIFPGFPASVYAERGLSHSQPIQEEPQLQLQERPAATATLERLI
ncbi:hypothetical protein CMO88_04185 [Candidatus Woesearchaeota archaeon]|nr:hypothetical protein [Candidatus Woesearchaeota archaeon]